MTEVSCQRRGALRAAHESKDVHGLDALLKGWKYPTSYAEYEDYYSKHRELEEGFKADLAEMRAAHESSDVQKLSAKLRDWKYSRNSSEYQNYDEMRGVLERGFAALLEEMQSAYDSNEKHTLAAKLEHWPYPRTYPEFADYERKVRDLEDDLRRAEQETTMVRTLWSSIS